MRIVHVTRSLIVHSGISVFVVELANAQSKLGYEVHLRYTMRPDYPTTENIDAKPFKGLSALGFVPDVVHVHALWSMDMARVMMWCRRHGVPYVVSPHGGLMPRVLSKCWLKKHIFYWLFLRKSLQRAKAIHCTGEGEKRAIQALDLQTPIVIAPLGCHLPAWPVDRIQGEKKTILFLSRLGEEKGLLHLLDAWKQVGHDGWKLVLAGPDSGGFLSVIRNKIATERIEDVELPGAVYGKEKDRIYRMADLFVLPSPVENFSMSILDALAYGIPVICTTGVPWGCVSEHHCGWVVKPESSDALRTALLEAMSEATDCAAMSIRARQLAEGFEWGKVAEKLENGYKGGVA